MRRVSSPPSSFSTLMTSAPMSASISPQTGPAITWLRSITRMPLSGPERSAVIPRRLSFCARPCFTPTVAQDLRGNKLQCFVRWQRAQELRDHFVGHIREAWRVPLRSLVLVDQEGADAFEELAVFEEADSQPVFNI